MIRTKPAIYQYTLIVYRCTSKVCYEVIAHNILTAEIFTIKIDRLTYKQFI